MNGPLRDDGVILLSHNYVESWVCLQAELLNWGFLSQCICQCNSQNLTTLGQKNLKATAAFLCPLCCLLLIHLLPFITSLCGVRQHPLPPVPSHLLFSFHLFIKSVLGLLSLLPFSAKLKEIINERTQQTTTNLTAHTP